MQTFTIGISVVVLEGSYKYEWSTSPWYRYQYSILVLLSVQTHPCSHRVPLPGRGIPACSGRSAGPPRWLCIDTDPRSSRRPRRCGRRTARPAETRAGRSHTLRRDNGHDKLRGVSLQEVTRQPWSSFGNISEGVGS